MGKESTKILKVGGSSKSSSGGGSSSGVVAVGLLTP